MDQAELLAEILAILRKLDAAFEELRPVLERYSRNPAARFRRAGKEQP